MTVGTLSTDYHSTLNLQSKQLILGAPQTALRAPLQGAATWRIKTHYPKTIVDLSGMLRNDSCSQFGVYCCNWCAEGIKTPPLGPGHIPCGYIRPDISLPGQFPLPFYML